MPHALYPMGLGGVGGGIGRGAFKLQCKLQFKCLCKLGGVGVGAFLFLPKKLVECRPATGTCLFPVQYTFLGLWGMPCSRFCFICVHNQALPATG